MGNRSLAFVLLLIGASRVAAQKTDQSVATVRAAIDRGNAAYIEAFARRDAVALAAVYDPDGARLGQQGRFSRGRDAIANEVQAFVGRVGPVKVTLETVDVWVVGPTAYETGKWSYRFTAPGKEATTISGRYVTVWRRQPDDGWLIVADMGVPGT